MGEQSKTADSTFNPWTMRAGSLMRTSPACWRQPLRWNARGFRECCKCGHRGDTGEWSGADPLGCPDCGSHDWKQASRRVFCASLSDWLDNDSKTLRRRQGQLLRRKAGAL